MGEKLEGGGGGGAEDRIKLTGENKSIIRWYH